MDNEHRADGVVDDLVADRAEHQALEATEAPAADDDDVGVRRCSRT